MTASKIQSRPNTIYNSINAISTSPTNRALGYNSATVLDVANRLRNTNTTPKRVLFGAPSPGDAQRLLNEQVERDRQRIINRFQFDVMTEKYVAGGRSSPTNSKTKDSPPKKIYCLRQKSDSWLTTSSSSSNSNSNSNKSNNNKYDKDKMATRK